MTQPLNFEVITPDKNILDTEADYLRVLLPDGWWGILPGHASMISYIHSGIIYYQKDEKIRYVAIYQGTIQVEHSPHDATRIKVMTAAAEEGDDLDAVQAALAHQALKLADVAKEADLEFNQLRLSLEKSLQNANITDMRLG